ncbi:LysR family transcriptional regulator [Mesorhizobium sp. LSHC412B00]|uniref:LysR family transcriptional regulator n=1 Tax=Mesorhizobium sp. LSHC412B00 TaxID=1287285 RepID=UPI0003CEA89A|nr:LysR family transcriptional regulator [Mesorhizobium sp. LSHC412B00]ESX90848.1 LysR family transcriptional regulator [Mesorhizobium sp. LSHC412B00]
MRSLDDMALFVEVAKARSFRGAAEILGIPNSTLSRRISRLENAIGLRLLHRTTRKIELTEAGEIYYERCKRIVQEARLAHEQLGQMLAQPTGLLRVTLPVDFGQIFLAPLIADFARRYPGITFDFDLSPRRVDLVGEPVDVAIRMGESPDSNLISRLLFRLPRMLYAAPAYLEHAGEPSHPDQLKQHQCLRLHTSEADTWKLHRGVDTIDAKVGGRFMMNNVGMIQRLCTLGMGVAVLAERVAAADVANGALQRILPDWQATAIAINAITETRLLPAKTQRFVDFLREQWR